MASSARAQDYGASLRDHRHGRKAAARGRRRRNFIISGRYMLEPEIFDLLAKGQKGAGGEIQLTDSMIELAKTQKFFGRALRRQDL